MPQIKVDRLLDEMSLEFGQALIRTLKRRYPNDPTSRYALLKEFRREMNRVCDTWTEVSEQAVRND